MIMKVLVVYDSLGGNTEKMARAITVGANSVEGIEAEVNKIGEPFPLTALAESTMVVFGSPVIYSKVTDGMMSFLEQVTQHIEAGRLTVGERRAAIFGSCSFRTQIIEERLKEMVEDLGYDVGEKVCVEKASNIKNSSEASIKKCRDFGKELAESLRRREASK
jgi:flavorubredoxin